MDEYAPPSGPPPPKAPDVPAGWAARWNEQYKEWFYVNVYTKKSQWEKPTAPVFPVDDNAPTGPPPGYEGGDRPVPTDTKKNPYDDHSRGAAAEYANQGGAEDDAAMARRLQAEEDQRARSGYGGAQPPQGYGGGNSPYPQQGSSYQGGQGQYGSPSGGFPNELPPRDRGKSGGGFLGKLLGKGKSSGAGYGGGQGGYGGGYPQQGGYPPQGGYPQQGGYYPPQQGYGGAPGGYGGGGYGGPQYAQKPPQKSGGHGMGMAAGGAALGLGAGLVGGMLIEDAIDDHEQEAYDQGYENGQDNDYGGDDGGDFDGGDF